MRFGPVADVERFYARLEASPEYAAFCRPDADDIRQARIESLRKRRVRRPTLRTVLAAAKRAGLDVAAVQVNGDGSIVLTPGTPTDVRDVTDAPATASSWD